mmetsp:Transcript_39868/g.66598  ORF Transcript_39868/g.66598 Transcript_39868/m.66598 type:complete len:692 (-) Transcript_39868:298-2373(-)
MRPTFDQLESSEMAFQLLCGLVSSLNVSQGTIWETSSCNRLDRFLQTTAIRHRSSECTFFVSTRSLSRSFTPQRSFSFHTGDGSVSTFVFYAYTINEVIGKDNELHSKRRGRSPKNPVQVFSSGFGDFRSKRPRASRLSRINSRPTSSLPIDGIVPSTSDVISSLNNGNGNGKHVVSLLQSEILSAPPVMLDSEQGVSSPSPNLDFSDSESAVDEIDLNPADIEAADGDAIGAPASTDDGRHERHALLMQKLEGAIKNFDDNDFVELRQMLKEGWVPPPYFIERLLSKLSWRRKMRQAHKIIDILIHYGIKPSLKAFNHVIDCCCKNRELILAMDLLNRMQQICVHPDRFTYSTVIDGWAQTGKAHRAVRVFERMKNSEVKPDAGVYGAMVKACAAAGSFDLAFTFLEDCKREGVVPNIIIYNTLIAMCSKSGDLGRAFQMFEEMEASSVTPDTRTFSNMIDACGRRGRLQMALQLKGIMQARGFSPDLYIYNSLIGCCARTQDLAGCMSIFEEAISADVMPTTRTYNLLLSCCANCGLMDEEAIPILHRMRNGPNPAVPDAVTFNTIFTGYAKKKDSAKVMMYFEQAKQAGLCNLTTYSAAFHALVQCGRLDLADGVKNEASSQGQSFYYKRRYAFDSDLRRRRRSSSRSTSSWNWPENDSEEVDDQAMSRLLALVQERAQKSKQNGGSS